MILFSGIMWHLHISFFLANANDVPKGIPTPRSTFGACDCRQRQINGILAQMAPSTDSVRKEQNKTVRRQRLGKLRSVVANGWIVELDRRIGSY